MAIVASDIVFRLSVVAAAGDTTASTGATALGDQVSTTVMPTTLHGLFDIVTGAENAASESEYRCVFVLNNHATLTLENPVIYLSGAVASGADVTIATDNIAVSAKGAATAQAATIANEDTAPTGVSAFSAPTTAGTGLALGNLAPGQVKGVWIKRTTANTGAVDADGVTLNVTGDTAA